MKKPLLAFIALVAVIFTGCFHEKPSATFRLGIDPSFIPLNTMGQEAHINGFCNELFQEVGIELKDSIELIKFSWDDLLPQLKSDKLDGIITTLLPYNFYKKDFSFSEPLLRTGPCLVSAKIHPYKTLSSLNGKIIGIIAATSSETFVSSEEGSIVQSFESPSGLLDALVRGQIDAALLDYLIAYAYCLDLYQDKLAITSKPLGDAGIRFMIKKTHPTAEELLKTLNAFLSKNSTSILLKKWQLPSNP